MCSVRFQKFDHLLLALGQREIQRTLVVLGSGGNVGAGGNQNLGHGEVAVLRHGMQSGPASVLAGVDWRSMLDQKLDQIRVTASGGGVQRQVLHGIGRSRRGRRAFVKQRPCGVGAAEESSQVERCPAIGAHSGYQRAIRREKMLDTSGISLHHCREDRERRIRGDDGINARLIVGADGFVDRSVRSLVVPIRRPAEKLPRPC